MCGSSVMNSSIATGGVQVVGGLPFSDTFNFEAFIAHVAAHLTTRLRCLCVQQARSR